jgi:hypothetical protein
LNDGTDSLNEPDALALSMDTTARRLAIMRLQRLGYEDSLHLAENAELYAPSSGRENVLSCPASDFVKLIIYVLRGVKTPRSWLAVPFFLLMSVKTKRIYHMWTAVCGTALVVPFQSRMVTENCFGAPGATGKAVNVVFGSNNFSNVGGVWSNVQSGEPMTAKDVPNHFSTLDDSAGMSLASMSSMQCPGLTLYILDWNTAGAGAGAGAEAPVHAQHAQRSVEQRAGMFCACTLFMHCPVLTS